jgi:hypothetical protein
MIRYSLFVFAVIGSAATAVAAIAPNSATQINPMNVTVIEKNQTWHVVNELTVQECAVADCSDTPQS